MLLKFLQFSLKKNSNNVLKNKQFLNIVAKCCPKTDIASSIHITNSSSLNIDLIFPSSKCVIDQSYFLCLHNDSSRSQRALHLHNANWTLSTHRTTEPRRPTLKWLPFNAMNWVSSAKYAFVLWTICVYTENHHKSTPSLMTTTFFQVHMRTRCYSFGRSETRSVHCVHPGRDTLSYCNIDGQCNWMQIYIFFFRNFYFGLVWHGQTHCRRCGRVKLLFILKTAF